MFVFRLLCLQIACLTIDWAGADRNYDIFFYPTVDTTIARPIQTLPPGYIHFPDIRTSYKVSNQRVNWWSARAACIREGASLAVIDTSTKVNYVKMMRPWLSWVWTGIYRESSGFRGWKDVNGNWLNHNLPWSAFNQRWYGNCAAVSGLNIGALCSWGCDLEKLYVCEIPEPPIIDRRGGY